MSYPKAYVEALKSELACERLGRLSEYLTGCDDDKISVGLVAQIVGEVLDLLVAPSLVSRWKEDA